MNELNTFQAYCSQREQYRAQGVRCSLAVKLIDCRKDLTWSDIGRAYRALFSDTPTGTFLVFVPGTWVSYREGTSK